MHTQNGDIARGLLCIKLGKGRLGLIHYHHLHHVFLEQPLWLRRYEFGREERVKPGILAAMWSLEIWSEVLSIIVKIIFMVNH